MDTIFLVIGAIVLFATVGLIAVIVKTFKVGHKGYTKGRDAIRERRNKGVQDRK